MHTENDYQLGVFNGDMGTVRMSEAPASELFTWLSKQQESESRAAAMVLGRVEQFSLRVPKQLGKRLRKALKPAGSRTSSQDQGDEELEDDSEEEEEPRPVIDYKYGAVALYEEVKDSIQLAYGITVHKSQASRGSLRCRAYPRFCRKLGPPHDRGPSSMSWWRSFLPTEATRS